MPAKGEAKEVMLSLRFVCLLAFLSDFKRDCAEPSSPSPVKLGGKVEHDPRKNWSGSESQGSTNEVFANVARCSVQPWWKPEVR